MIVTEEEAKTKLCPEAIGLGDINWVMVPTGRMCIGSACMAWRWAKVADLQVHSRVTRESPQKLQDDLIYGYCGKAGRP